MPRFGYRPESIGGPLERELGPVDEGVVPATSRPSLSGSTIHATTSPPTSATPTRRRCGPPPGRPPSPATSLPSARWSSSGGGRHGWRTAAAWAGSGRSVCSRRAAGMSCSPAHRSTSTPCCGRRGPEPLRDPPQRRVQPAGHADALGGHQVAGRDLQHPASNPFPGQPHLHVRPLPSMPNTYTVPFLDGRLVYAVFEGAPRRAWSASCAISREPDRGSGGRARVAGRAGHARGPRSRPGACCPPPPAGQQPG
jgi:hypothetical protein